MVWWKYAVGVAEFIIAGVALYVAYLQYQQAETQGEMARVQTEIAKHQEEIAETQESVDLLMFVREYVNGFVYLYDVVARDSAVGRVKEIRRVGLPAIAVPSQYGATVWLVVSQSFGNFPDLAVAEKEILSWRTSLKGWEYYDKSKTALFNKYQAKQLQRGVRSLVFFYKADIVAYRSYFESLARAKDLLVQRE